MLAAVFPEDECEVIMRYCAEFPDLWNRLDGFMWLDPEVRPRQALKLLKSLLRQEWLSYGITEQELDDLFAFKRRMINFDRHYRPESLDPLKTRIRIWVYDMPTAILGHSRADEAIPTEDSLKLQQIVGNVIFSSSTYQTNLEAMQSILKEDTLEDCWVKDMERLLLLNHVKNDTDNSAANEKFHQYWTEFRSSWRSMHSMLTSYQLKYEQPKPALIL